MASPLWLGVGVAAELALRLDDGDGVPVPVVERVPLALPVRDAVDVVVRDGVGDSVAV